MSGDLTPISEYAQLVPRRRNDDTGRFKEVYSDDEVLDTIRGTRLSTREVADELDCHRTTAHAKLRELEDEDKLMSTQVGNTYLWEISE